jgi:hypothetical protein
VVLSFLSFHRLLFIVLLLPLFFFGPSELYLFTTLNLFFVVKKKKKMKLSTIVLFAAVAVALVAVAHAAEADCPGDECKPHSPGYTMCGERKCVHQGATCCSGSEYCCASGMTCSTHFGRATCIPSPSSGSLAPNTAQMDATPLQSPPGVAKTSVEKCKEANTCSEHLK